MALKRLIAFLAFALMVAAPLASANARLLDAPKAPPSDPVYEVDPGERDGYTRVNGHWEWTGDSFRWKSGSWVENREGFIWVPDTWAQRGKKWRLIPGQYVATTEDTVATAPETLVISEGEPPEMRESELNALEENVLAPSKNVAKPAKKAVAKRYVKKINYSDPKQFPRYRRTDRR